MALMTTEQIKTYLKITDTTYDADIALYEPIAEAKVNEYVGCVIETLGVGYYPDYSRLVWTLIQEGTTEASTSGDVTAESFDGASFSYGDKTGKEVAETSTEALYKFKPLTQRWQ